MTASTTSQATLPVKTVVPAGLELIPDSGNSTIFTSPGLTYAGLPTTGGASKTADGAAATTINFRGFGTVYGDDEAETPISFLAQRNGAASAATFAGISLYNNVGEFPGSSELSLANGGTGGAWRILDAGSGI